MPVFTFKRNLKYDHPIVNKLCRDYVTTSRSSWRITKPCGSHLGFKILVYCLDIVFCQLGENSFRNIGSQYHLLYVGESFFWRLLISTQERLLKFLLPF